jgi:hypothetical protein
VGLYESSDFFVFGHHVITDEPVYFFFFAAFVTHASLSARYRVSFPTSADLG